MKGIYCNEVTHLKRPLWKGDQKAALPGRDSLGRPAPAGTPSCPPSGLTRRPLRQRPDTVLLYRPVGGRLIGFHALVGHINPRNTIDRSALHCSKTRTRTIRSEGNHAPSSSKETISDPVKIPSSIEATRAASSGLRNPSLSPYTCEQIRSAAQAIDQQAS